VISISNMSYGANAKRGRLFYFIELFGIKKQSASRQALKLFYRRTSKDGAATIHTCVSYASVREATVCNDSLRFIGNAGGGGHKVASAMIFDIDDVAGLFAGVFDHFNFMPLLDSLIECQQLGRDPIDYQAVYFSQIISHFVEEYR